MRLRNLTLNLLLVVGLTAATCCKSASLVTEKFLDKIKGLEDRDNRDGDQGRSRGAYQISKAAWTDVNRMFRHEGRKQYSWDYARKEFVGRLYCRRYCEWLEYNLLMSLGSASQAQIYAAYNAGLTAVLNAKGNVHNMADSVRSRCAVFWD